MCTLTTGATFRENITIVSPKHIVMARDYNSMKNKISQKLLRLPWFTIAVCLGVRNCFCFVNLYLYLQLEGIQFPPPPPAYFTCLTYDIIRMIDFFSINEGMRLYLRHLPFVFAVELDHTARIYIKNIW